MKISDQYQISDIMPEVFLPAVWTDERPVANRTATDANTFSAFVRSLGSKFNVGMPCALPDAMQGGAAPALPMNLIVDAGYAAAKLFYAVDVTMQTGTGPKTVKVEIGQAIDILDGPQGTYLDRLSRLLENIDGPGGVSSIELLTIVDPVIEGMEAAAKKLLAPFKK